MIAQDFYPGDFGSSPVTDVGSFQTMYHFSCTNIHICKNDNATSVGVSKKRQIHENALYLIEHAID